MNQEIQIKIEQEVKAYTTAYIHNYGQHIGDIVKRDFISIYQNILENPAEWGLVHPHSQKLAEEVLAMESQLAKYREALGRIANEDDEPLGDVGIVEAKWIAKEALKQEVNND